MELLKITSRRFKYHFCFLLLTFSLNSVIAQCIDNLNTNKKVARFLKKNVNKEYTFKYVFDRQTEIDQEDFEYNIKKIDLDNNGYTDLIITAAYPSIIVINQGNNSYKELNFNATKSIYKNAYVLDSVVSIGNEKILIFKTKIQSYDNIETEKFKKQQSHNSEKFKIDSLLVKFGELVTYKKYKSNFEATTINEIYFSAEGCYWDCPKFRIKVTTDGFIEYIGDQYTNYKAIKRIKLPHRNYKDLIGLIEYTNIKSLKDNYSVNWTDDKTVILKVTYKNGTTKRIQDYGLQSTINLKAIYNKFYEIYSKINLKL